jgi:predicted AAA+ superfamily ATPase
MVQLNDYILNHIAKTPLILSRYNKERKRIDYTILKEKVDKYIENDKKELVILYGLRGLGKTTLLSQIYHYARLKIEPNKVLYFSMDELKLNDIKLFDALKAYSEIFNINPYKDKLILLLDEIQYEKHWDLVLKNLYDTTNIFIIATYIDRYKRE